jgi:uncharacterized Zn finger protein
VISLHLETGTVQAQVQGSQPLPFRCAFGLRPCPDERVAALIAHVRHAPGLLAEIVSGTLRPELGPLLLPTAGEFTADCTCPDQAPLCRHIAAVAYRTAERLDERPLDILTLRGLNLDLLIDGVQTHEPHSAAAESDEAESDDTDDLYGDSVALPALPLAEIRPAIDDLDPVPLRAALRLVTADERVVAAALRQLQGLYHTLTQR